MPAGNVRADDLHFGAESAHMINFFLRHLVGNNQQHPVTLRACHQGQTETGIAGGGFNDGAAGLQFSIPFRRLDHGQGHAILNGAGRVLVLQFHEELARARVHAGDLHQRRLTDERKNGRRFLLGGGGWGDLNHRQFILARDSNNPFSLCRYPRNQHRTCRGLRSFTAPPALRLYATTRTCCPPRIAGARENAPLRN